jgi:hypothetical protein
MSFSHFPLGKQAMLIPQQAMGNARIVSVVVVLIIT